MIEFLCRERLYQSTVALSHALHLRFLHITRSLVSFRRAPDLVINLRCGMHFISPL